MTAQEPASPGSFNNVRMLTFEELSVGDRVQSRDDSRATVRFLGAVTGATPEDCWVGIEWDEEGRGKHDGSAKGKRYFECPQGHGSFVRADTVLKAPRTFQASPQRAGPGTSLTARLA
jgi:dynactin complex subunit